MIMNLCVILIYYLYAKRKAGNKTLNYQKLQENLLNLYFPLYVSKLAFIFYAAFVPHPPSQQHHSPSKSRCLCLRLSYSGPQEGMSDKVIFPGQISLLQNIIWISLRTNEEHDYQVVTHPITFKFDSSPGTQRPVVIFLTAKEGIHYPAQRSSHFLPHKMFLDVRSQCGYGGPHEVTNMQNLCELQETP